MLWLDGKASCDDCKELARIYNEVPDCKNCIPELYPENQIVFEIYNFVAGQTIQSFSGPVTLNLLTVFRVLELFNIEKQDQKYTIDLLTGAYHTVLAKHREKDGNFDDFVESRKNA